MRMRRVPKHLQVKVIKWFDYLWLTQKCSDEEKAVSCLPGKFSRKRNSGYSKKKKKIRKNLKMKKISNERTNSSFSRYTYLFHGICIIFAWMLLPLPLFLLIHVNRVSRFIPSDLFLFFFFLFVILFHLASKVFLLDFFYSVQTSKYIRNKEM